MPFINKIQVKKTSSATTKSETDARELRRKAYNNTTWRKLREVYFHEHPLCEKCLETGKITAAEDVHHKKSPFKNGEINYNLLLDKNNLMSVCKQCHAEIHNKQNGNITAADVLKQLDDLFNENIKDEDLE
jgi:5-methylcytosine-specific restriction endonuclease McrA